MHKCRRKARRKQGQAHWNAKLKAMGLGMDAGRWLGEAPITYGHVYRESDKTLAAYGVITGESLESSGDGAERETRETKEKNRA